ncbi:MAG: hypothetical protein CEO21_127, partial [Microgenomates group bacterium Gr01-1014_80]
MLLDRALGGSVSRSVFNLGIPAPQVEFEPPDSVDLALFESGKTFSKDILQDPEKLVKIAEVSSQFPVLSTNADRDRQAPIKEIPLNVDSAQLAKAKAERISLLTAYGEKVGIVLYL